MKLARRSLQKLILVGGLCGVVGLCATSTAYAQSDADAAGDSENEEAGLDPEQPSAPPATVQSRATKARLGVGARVRGTFIPKSILKLFIEELPEGVSQPSFGLEVIRRKGNFDVVVGLDYQSVAPGCPDPDLCLYLEKGDDPEVPGQFPDHVVFDGFSMIGIDAAFLWHEPITDFFAIRYGAGLGLGILLGEVRQTDTRCSAGTTPETIQERCMPDTSPGSQVDDPAEVPPVVPIVELVLGGRFKITDNVALNVEAGFRNLFYVGGGVGYFF